MDTTELKEEHSYSPPKVDLRDSEISTIYSSTYEGLVSASGGQSVQLWDSDEEADDEEARRGARIRLLARVGEDSVDLQRDAHGLPCVGICSKMLPCWWWDSVALLLLVGSHIYVVTYSTLILIMCFSKSILSKFEQEFSVMPFTGKLACLGMTYGFATGKVGSIRPLWETNMMRRYSALCIITAILATIKGSMEANDSGMTLGILMFIFDTIFVITVPAIVYVIDYYYWNTWTIVTFTYFMGMCVLKSIMISEYVPFGSGIQKDTYTVFAGLLMYLMFIFNLLIYLCALGFCWCKLTIKQAQLFQQGVPFFTFVLH